MNLILTPIHFIVGIVGIFWLALVGGFVEYKLDRLPAGWPNAHVPFPASIVWNGHLPDSLGAGYEARLTKQAADLKASIANEALLRDALHIQSVAAQAVQAKGRAALAQAEVPTRQAIAHAPVEAKQEAIASAPLPAGDLLTRYEAADTQFVAALRAGQ